MNNTEFITFFYSTIYNTCVEYHGSRREVIDFLSKFDIWNGHGRLLDYSEPAYRFEFSKEMHTYMQSEDFVRVMRRMNVNVKKEGNI